MKVRSFVMEFERSDTEESLLQVEDAWKRLWKAVGGASVDIDYKRRQMTLTLHGAGATPELMELFFKELQK